MGKPQIALNCPTITKLITVLSYTVYCTAGKRETYKIKGVRNSITVSKKVQINRLISVSNLLGSELQSLWPQYGLMAPP